MDAQLEYPRLLPSVLVPEHRDGKRTTRDWVVDWLCFLIALVVGTLVYADAHNHTDLPEWFAALDGLVGVAACFSLWMRRRWPFGLALVLTLLSIVFSGVGGAAAIALFTVAVHEPFRRAAPIAVLGAVLQPLYIAIYSSSSDPYLVALVLSWLVIGVVLVWGMFVRSRRQLVLSLRDRAERAETEQQLRVEQARQAERARIAREMHDVLAHRISLLSLHAGALEFRPDAPPEEVARAAGVIRASAHSALEDLRAVIGVLREAPGDAPEPPQPTLADLAALIEESRGAGMRVTFSSPDALSPPDSLGRNAYRIVQEGLTNARKHARGSTVDVVVSGGAQDGLEIEIRNRLPVGAVAAASGIPGAGTGIIGLAERASLAGGRLEHGRTEAGDYRLWVWLPWPA